MSELITDKDAARIRERNRLDHLHHEGRGSIASREELCRLLDTRDELVAALEGEHGVGEDLDPATCSTCAFLAKLHGGPS